VPAGERASARRGGRSGRRAARPGGPILGSGSGERRIAARVVKNLPAANLSRARGVGQAQEDSSMKRSLVLSLALGLSGCAWVSLDPGAESVSVRDADSLDGCQRLGKTHTNTVDSLGFIPRRQSKVEEELVRLARNEAVRMGGNVVSPLSRPVDGEQDFTIHRCP